MPLRLALAAMATRFELLLDPGARAAGEAALAEIAEVEQWLSQFRRDSVVARLVGETASAAVLPREEIVLFELCRRGCERTDGAFDPALGDPRFSSWPIDRRARRVVAPAAARRLDFGGVGKGHALDRAVKVLREAGVTRALLHGGTSSVAALGAPPGGDAWRVAIRAPRTLDEREERDPRRALATVALRDRSLSVSARHGGGGASSHLGHIVDPRDSAPIERARLAAVVARHGAVAEIASTALLVLAERCLRRGEPLTRERLRLSANVTALVAWIDGTASLQVALFGPETALFEIARHPQLEPCR